MTIATNRTTTPFQNVLLQYDSEIDFALEKLRNEIFQDVVEHYDDPYAFLKDHKEDIDLFDDNFVDVLNQFDLIEDSMDADYEDGGYFVNMVALSNGIDAILRDEPETYILTDRSFKTNLDWIMNDFYVQCNEITDEALDLREIFSCCRYFEDIEPELIKVINKFKDCLSLRKSIINGDYGSRKYSFMYQDEYFPEESKYAIIENAHQLQKVINELDYNITETTLP